MQPDNAKPAQSSPASPVPQTLEGWSILHQLFRVRWSEWRALGDAERKLLIDEATAVLSEMEGQKAGPSAVFSVLGHKGDLMLVHFRRGFDDLGAAELRLANLGLERFLEPTSSYVSVVELGLYAATARIDAKLRAAGHEPGSDAWKQGLEAELAEEREAQELRLYPPVPPRRYLCFYPMDRRRGESVNWYRLSLEERQRMMRDHGAIGRRYAGRVMQIISGSIGFDDWEWGVDLFADEPLVFKKLIYEMRFDEASASYAAFGPFYVGLRFAADQLGDFLAGTLPAWPPR